MGSFDFSKSQPLLYLPPDTASKEYVVIDFFCLASTHQWKLNKSSKVYLRFAAAELGTFDSCHGPMFLIERFVIYSFFYPTEAIHQSFLLGYI